MPRNSDAVNLDGLLALLAGVVALAGFLLWAIGRDAQMDADADDADTMPPFDPTRWVVWYRENVRPGERFEWHKHRWHVLTDKATYAEAEQAWWEWMRRRDWSRYSWMVWQGKDGVP